MQKKAGLLLELIPGPCRKELLGFALLFVGGGGGAVYDNDDRAGWIYGGTGGTSSFGTLIKASGGSRWWYLSCGY